MSNLIVAARPTRPRPWIFTFADSLTGTVTLTAGIKGGGFLVFVGSQAEGRL